MDSLQPTTPESRVTLQPPEPLPTPKRKPSWMVLFVLLMLIGIAVLGYVTRAKLAQIIGLTKTIASVTPTATPLMATPVPSGGVFIPYVPNFNALTLADLPTFRDNRGVFPYGSHYIVAGIDRIAEYDPQTDQIIRQNNPAVLGCVYSVTKIGNFLYVACNNPRFDVSGQIAGKATLEKIDLTTGEIAKNYFTGDSLHRVNIWVTSRGTDLWGSSWDGVFRIDTANGDQEKDYSFADIGYPGCRAQNIALKDDRIVVHITAGSDCAGATAIYDYASNTWTKGPESNDLMGSVNSLPSVNGQPLPFYVAVSQLVGNKYYVFSQNSVYTLESGQFPHKLFLSPILIPTYDFTTAYVSPDEQYAVLIELGAMGPSAEGGTLTSSMPIILINLKTHETKNLMTGFSPLTPAKEQEIFGFASDGIVFIPLTDGVVLQSKKGSTTFGQINFSSGTVSFN